MFVQITNQLRNSKFELRGKRSWKKPMGHCEGHCDSTSQHSEEKLEKWWWIRMWMAYT